MKSFNEIDHIPFMDHRAKALANEINNTQKDYIIRVDENEYKKYLFEKFKFELLKINYESEHIDPPNVKQETVHDNMWNRTYVQDVYYFTVTYSFTGSAELFNMRSTSWHITFAEINIDHINNKVSLVIKLTELDSDKFNRNKADILARAFRNLENVNKDALNWNNSLPANINYLFSRVKSKYEKENSFYAAINVKINPGTQSIFTAPTIKKKIIPQPTASKNKEFSSEPTMSNEMYNDVLKVVYDSGKNMEKKPSLYQNKDEEGLRDQFLFVLETRYEGTTASGETFNRGGKTDIILKYAKDGSNLFVAECKFWHGASEFLKAISQLFDRYLTWRDSKVALILFVKNKEFSNILDTIKSEISNHPYFVSKIGDRGETSFSYKFRLPQDENKQVLFEVIAFHYDK
ncbi:hypothetical protein [Larkinella terrae]|uniref:Uncharacterized protein n=1 Tax=Larkinella terrae TaxID=2025311 RepID=A0A7K0EQ54_9BACT|nr:hypothetical protein [Larkinella terrae]MRS63944.1 hypothetical protein [Larkinella terrae]